MKMKLLCSVVLVTLVVSLVACGGGSGGTEASKQFMESEQESTETVTNDKPAMEETGEFTAEEYQGLAQQYQEQGLIRKQRDVLEKSYRLYGDLAAFEMLQTISVNLADEDEAVREQANLMFQNLELKEYLDESINLISTEKWFQTMMPNLQEGYRSYFLQKGGQTVLYIQAGYTRTGEVSAKVWYLGEQVRVLRREGNTLQLLETRMAEGNYRGAFESWTLDGETGDIYHETGTFGNGVITGEYEISIHEGAQGSDLFSLWSNREGMSYTTYNGTFDDRGISTLEQPAENKMASLLSGTEYDSCIVYAIDVNDCLFEGLTEGETPATYVFSIEKMGWELFPDDQNNGKDNRGNSGMTDYRRNRGTLPKDKVVTKPATQTPAQQPVPQEQPQQTPQQSAPAPTPSKPQ